MRKGLLLYTSLRRHSKNARPVLLVLALSERCEQALRKLSLPDLIILKLKDIESKYPELNNAKTNRKLVEYYFTLTPYIIKAALEEVPSASRVTYLDSDLYFFSSPEPLWQEIKNSPIAMVEHRFSPLYRDKIIFGRFNVGWNTFDRSEEAHSALSWWANACNRWCYDRVEGEKFADQGYLTNIHRNYDNVHVLEYPGINLAEYNLDNYNIELKKGRPWADKLPVIYWHMHCILEKKDGTFHVILREDLGQNFVVQYVFNEYIKKMQDLSKKLEAIGIEIGRGNARYDHESL